MQKSKDSLKDCFENVNSIKWELDNTTLFLSFKLYSNSMRTLSEIQSKALHIRVSTDVYFLEKSPLCIIIQYITILTSANITLHVFDKYIIIISWVIFLNNFIYYTTKTYALGNSNKLASLQK